MTVKKDDEEGKEGFRTYRPKSVSSLLILFNAIGTVLDVCFV